MTPLQWALLLMGVGIAGVLVLSSRRERRLLERSVNVAQRSRAVVGQDWTPSPEAGAQSGLNFDEFGVSKPRRHSASEVNMAPKPAAPKGTEKVKSAPILAQDASTEAIQKDRASPALAPGASAGVNEKTLKSSALALGASEKLIALYIAEHEGTNILGPKIHAALAAQGLRFGGKRIYHRFNGEQPVFSVASLVKPGALDPAEAADFSTPGLSVFMQLPGPSEPKAALADMLDTARQLARALNAELYDTEQRQPLTPERERVLQTQVRDWAQQKKTG